MLAFLPILFASAFATLVNVMLPLTVVSNDGYLNTDVEKYFQSLKNAGVHGVMCDVWWGIAEPNPQEYRFDAWVQLADMCNKYGLKLLAIMSFHQCGGNVGDDCNIPIPQWVRNNQNIYYRDIHGHDDLEVVALDVDNEQVLNGRTPLQCYKDFMEAFANAMGSRMGNVVEEVEVGLGPCGELRYPGYQLDRWSFPGVGEFQCYSDNMKSSFANYTKSQGHPEWDAPPSDAGSYNSRPWDTQFFNGGYSTEYGKAFLQWYSDSLLDHGRRVLEVAVSIFKPLNVKLAAKVSGIHWWYNHDSHAAELTTGYVNGNFLSPDTYNKIAQMCGQLGVILDFTCFEMANNEQDGSAYSNPEGLVYQVLMAAKNNGAELSAENALARYDTTAYDRIILNSCNRGGKVYAFTYLRLNDNLVFNEGNFNNFKYLISRLSGC